MKRQFGISVRRAVSMLLAIVLCLGGVSFAAAEEKTTAVRTILLYDCGSNLESDYDMATWNLYQILKAEIPETIHFVVLTGGAVSWQTEQEYLEGAEGVSLNGQNQIWVCSGRNADNAENGHGKMTLQEDMPKEIETSYLSDGETLRIFIDYAAEKFPAQIYDLILWDHGGGPQYGFGLDERDQEGNLMSVGAVAKALEDSRVDRFDIVNFDACLMSSVEIAAMLSEYADYLILSAETEPQFGQEYTTWLNALAAQPDMNGFDLGRIVVDAFVAFYENPESEGYGQGGTLAVIDTKAFQERLMPQITEMAHIMDRELTVVSKENLLLNFQDEYRSQAAAFPYYSGDLLDLGSFAGYLGIAMSELDGDAAIDITTMNNAYTETAGAITEILADMDRSGDDVIYFRATESMTVPVTAKVAYTRDSEGQLVRMEKMAPTGLSIFFAPYRDSAMYYMQAMDEMREVARDEGVREMLKAVETVSLRFLISMAAGKRVNTLRKSGVENVYYKAVQDSWKAYRELSKEEISMYASMMHLSDNVVITQMHATDWDAYIGDVIGWLDNNSEIDTETWLALLVAQQSSMALDTDKASAVALDLNGDGGMDAARVTLPVPISLIRDISLTVNWEVEEDFEVQIGKINGTPVTDEAVQLYQKYGSMDDAVHEIYRAETCAFDVPVVVDKWYEILGSDGVGHMISLKDMDSVRSNELKIPVRVVFADVDENGYPETNEGYLIYRDGHFVGFLDAYARDPMVSLSSRKFDGAAIQPAVAIPFTEAVDIIMPFDDADAGILLDAERTDDRGMKLVMTSLEEISYLQDSSLKTSTVVTDLYGSRHDISATLEKARDEAWYGNILRSVETARINSPQLTYNRRRQEPQFTVTVGGTELVKDQDYRVIGESMFKAGTQEYMIVGIGNYVGVKQASCTLVRAESTVEAAETVALAEIADAERIILTANTPAHPGNIQFDFSGTGEGLRQYLETSEDGRAVLLKQGAEAGSYVIAVTVSGGEEDTYTEISGETYTIEVK